MVKPDEDYNRFNNQGIMPQWEAKKFDMMVLVDVGAEEEWDERVSEVINDARDKFENFDEKFAVFENKNYD